MTIDEFAELAAGHALSALSPQDERAFAAAVQEHPEWAAIVEADAATAAGLADGVSDVEPPAHIRAELMARITTAPAEQEALAPDNAAPAVQPPAADIAPVDDAPGRDIPPAPATDVIQTVQRRQWTRGLLALAASFVLLIALGFGAARLGGMLLDPQSPDLIALEQIESAPDAQSASSVVSTGGEATVHWSESLGTVVLVADDLAPLDDEETYELWFVRGDTPVSAGIFDPDADGSATALLSGEMSPDDVVAVTVEPAGGSPTGTPSSEPIVSIPTT